MAVTNGRHHPIASALTPSPVARVIPRGFATAELSLVGTSPILMSAVGDRESADYRAFVMLGAKKRKSLDDEARLRELEWQQRLYLDPEIGPYIPSAAIKEMLRSAATKWSKGEDVKRSLIVVAQRVPLQYDGPRDQKGLWDEGFRYTTMVVNSGFNAGRVMRCRPMFPDWRVETRLAYDPSDIDPDVLALIVERSERYGLLDYRPAKGGEFGTFIATINGENIHYPPNNGVALKARDAISDANHEAFKARITG